MTDTYEHLRTKEANEKRTQSLRDLWADPERREAQMAKMHTEESRAKRSASLKEYHRKLKESNND